MNGIYKVRTDAGYFYATSNGRYGRFGEFQDGWRLCETCANNVIKGLRVAEINPVLEAVQPWNCQQCQVKKITNNE